MKICLINNLYKPYDRGGAEKYVEKLSEGFSKLKHEVFVVSTKPPGKTRISENKNTVYFLNSFYYHLDKIPNYFRFFWHLANVFNIVKYYQVKKIIDETNPDIVITNNLMGLGYLLPRLFFKKSIKHVHVLHDIQLLHPSGLMFLGKESILDNKLAKIYQKINLFLFKKIKYVVSPSDWLFKKHLERGFFSGIEYKKLFNPTDSPINNIQVHKSKFINFLYVGQIENHKGITELLDLVENMIITGSYIRLSIVGSGSLLSALKEKFNNPNIKFFGKLNKNEILEKMLAADCLLVPSLCYENSPTVIYEAALCNLDFIFSNLGGTNEIGEYFAGTSFDPRVDESLRNTLIAFIKNKSISIDRQKKVLNISTENYMKELLILLKII